MNRRQTLAGGLLGGLAMCVVPRDASAGTGDNNLCEIAQSIISFADPSEEMPTGTLPPGTKDRITAFRILASAPTSSPYDAAKYFSNLTEEGSGGPFKQEWTKYYNPVIYGFLSMTFSAPFKGDETHWCAAFVNFCLLWCSREATQSHASASFRSWTALNDKGTDKPIEGDLVVFRDIGKDGKPTTTGHVAFYKSINVAEETITCVGGNQGGASFNGGAVTEDNYEIKRLPTSTKEGRELVGFVSIAKIPKTKF